MRRVYRIRVLGKPRENPDPAMLAQIVLLIGRRLHTEHLQQRQEAPHIAGKSKPPENLPWAVELPSAESDTDSGPGDGG